MSGPRFRFVAGAIAAGLAVGALPVVLFLALFGTEGTILPGGAACPFRATGALEQWIVLVTAFGVKPAYMLLSLGLTVMLARSQAADLLALAWGLGLFLAGEAACAFNYVALGGESLLWEYFHDYGMVAGFACVAWAVLEGADRRIIRFSASRERCAALALCRRCVKFDSAAPCGLPRVFGFGLLALAALALLPLCAPLVPVAYTTEVARATVTYAAPFAAQWFVLRYCPLLALALLAAAWAALQLRRDHEVALPKLLLAAALGPLGFSLMRQYLLSAFRHDLVWYTSWEEITELLFVLGVGLVLWTFRHGLFSPEPPAPARHSPPA